MNAFTRALGIRYPVICGAMYPCSNPELVAAASAAGGIGIVQPLSLMYVHRHDLREGLRLIRRLTDKPYGFNVITEASSKIYQDRMSRWLDVALEEGCRFFVTALGNPRWVVDRVKARGGIVYHDVTELKWAEKARDAGIDGLISVNNRAGGHAGVRSPEALFAELAPLGLPLICAGGIGDADGAVAAMRLGYAGVQLGTRFIATEECKAPVEYKQAILHATADDIVLTKKLTGVPVSVIRNEFVERMGTEPGWLASRMLQHPRLKHWMRLYYSLNSLRSLKKSLALGNLKDEVEKATREASKGAASDEYWQAGKSVDSIESIEPAGEIMRRLGEACLKT